MANKDHIAEETVAEINEHVEALEELVRSLPVRFGVKEQLIRGLVEWEDEVKDATTLSPTDW